MLLKHQGMCNKYHVFLDIFHVAQLQLGNFPCYIVSFQPSLARSLCYHCCYLFRLNNIRFITTVICNRYSDLILAKFAWLFYSRQLNTNLYYITNFLLVSLSECLSQCLRVKHVTIVTWCYHGLRPGRRSTETVNDPM